MESNFTGSTPPSQWVLSATDSESESKVTVKTKFSLKFEKSESNGGKLLRGKVLDPASLELVNDIPNTAVLKFPKTRIS